MRKPDRRRFLTTTAAIAGLTSCSSKDQPPAAQASLGAHMRPYGEPSPYEQQPVRVVRELTASKGTGSSRTPLQDLYGTITPSPLHYERHHAGVPSIDPAQHQLLIHGLVDKPLTFTPADIRRFPSFTRIYFLECGGNMVGDLAGNPPPTVQASHGLVSGTEWTGVPLSTILREAGLKPEARWIIAEGADHSRMARSIPIEKCLDDTLIAYGQNGEALRPEQGYPLRLLVPGWEGNVSVKWLRRLFVTDKPAMSVKETAYYSELRPDGKAEQFSFVMEARSVITKPSGGQSMQGPGFYEITGLAWTGSGKIARVEVSTDGGKSWAGAQLQQPVLDKALVRFLYPWNWDGRDAVLQSRCTDETGYTQPTRDELIATRGPHSGYHYNAIKSWYVRADGSVNHV